MAVLTSFEKDPVRVTIYGGIMLLIFILVKWRKRRKVKVKNSIQIEMILPEVVSSQLNRGKLNGRKKRVQLETKGKKEKFTWKFNEKKK
ncbi:MAG: hypothetical protein ACTSUL_03745 [Promethearchaeota archaeon]